MIQALGRTVAEPFAEVPGAFEHTNDRIDGGDVLWEIRLH